MSIRRYLFVADQRRGHGTGHAVRARRAADELVRIVGPNLCRADFAPIRDDYISEPHCLGTANARLESCAGAPPSSACRAGVEEGGERTGSEVPADSAGTGALEGVALFEGLFPSAAFGQSPETPKVGASGLPRYDAVVLDARHVEAAHVRRLLELGPVFGVDVGGPGRRYCSYLLDTLPNEEPHRPNAVDPGANTLPARSRYSVETAEPRVLITLGGEDPNGLTRSVLRAVRRTVPNARVTVAIGSRFRREDTGTERAGPSDCAGPSVLRTDNLAAHLGAYDVVICGFGLTALEALSAGAAVAIVGHSSYHSRLAAQWGLPVCGTRAVRRGLLARFFRELSHVYRRQEALRPAPGRTIAQRIAEFRPTTSGASPATGGRGNRVLERTAERTFRRAGVPGVVFLERFHENRICYGSPYFLEEYASQYGRSYLEDFSHIRRLSRPRVRHLSTVVPKEGRVLDLGCAYGPFLAEVEAAGFRPYGVEPYEPAARYVREELCIPAWAGTVERLDPERAFGVPLFDAVTLWYVIEHLVDLAELFRRLRRWVRPGGALAFSTPSLSGISALRDRRAFLEAGPDDHLTVWDPRRIDGYLRREGFRLRSIRSTGHHRERAPYPFSRLPQTVYRRFSALLGLGDTFEAYAVRDPRLDAGRRTAP